MVETRDMAALEDVESPKAKSRRRGLVFSRSRQVFMLFSRSSSGDGMMCSFATREAMGLRFQC